MANTGSDNPTVLVLDGGFSSQISQHVGCTADGDPLWSARFLQTHPEQVTNTHLDFLRAGADVILTNTYQASVGGFVKHLGVTEQEGYALIRRAVEFAKNARNTFLQECRESSNARRPPMIVGSVGPYGAHLHDGSEYDGNYADRTDLQTMRDWHTPRIKTLIEAGVDLLAFETIPCQKEAEMLVDLLKEFPTTKAWLSFSCKDNETLAHGENFQKVAKKCWDSNPEQLVAIGVNCCSPKIVTNLLKGINADRKENPIPFVTYPNSGEKYKPEVGWVEGSDCGSLDNYVHEWLDLGVRYVGGCCRTYDTDISRIRAQKIFGISAGKQQRDDKIKKLLKSNEDLQDQNLKLNFEISQLKKDIIKIKTEHFSEYLNLMKERDARYTLYFENLGLHMKIKELDGSSHPVDEVYGDPMILRIALDRCREQLSITQRELRSLKEEYAETVPRSEHDELTTKYYDVTKNYDTLATEHQALQESFKRVVATKKCIEEELSECKERCRELERAGTPRPQWELCADFIGGGRDRWRQLASGLSSRDVLRVLLKELGPAAESDNLEHFDGLGLDPAIPPYLRYEGKVRNLRLSRREVSVIINDIWLGKQQNGMDMSMQDYVTKYFEDRYQQPSVRAEWAYNVCAGAEQMLDEPQVKLLWGVLHGQLSEHIYWGHRAHWATLKEHLYKHCKERETISIEEFEKIAKSVFPLKSEVDIKNLSDVVRKQLKIKLNNNEICLDKLFQENEEGFDRVEFARELYRQRQLAQDKYIREVVAELGGRHAGNKPVSVDNLKRAFAIVDPAIDHIRMERYIRWAFSAPTADLRSVSPLPLRTLAARLAAGDIERVGPRTRPTHHRTTYR
ncbi:translin-associated factor X-interacting protein 1-like [Pectinophora gossypiella]|uniref:translin-associated factor X-interacting protein 1-like n=1 Tax=Pectinophora gossypiella TaxID=13191 RepID=UPI00214F1875|nr:translin-associated factor X-interacting protein 1-like [Pectinophora gossypiella]